MNVFVYGTLKQGHGNARRMEGAIVRVEEAVVTGYTLFENGIPYAVPARGFCVRGELVTIYDEFAPSVLKSLDQLEGHPNHYTRTPVTAVRVRDGFEVAAFMYVLNGEPYTGCAHLGESWPGSLDNRVYSTYNEGVGEADEEATADEGA